MWFLERFTLKLDGGILKQNMGCGPAASSAQEAGFLLGLCRVLSPHTAPNGAALLGWDGVFCSTVVGHGAIAQPLPAALSQSVRWLHPKTLQKPLSFLV